MTKAEKKKWINKIYYETLVKRDVAIIGSGDLKTPSKKRQYIKKLKYIVQKNNKYFLITPITALENFQIFIDNWNKTNEILKLEVIANYKATNRLNSNFMIAFSGAQRSFSQISQLGEMREITPDREKKLITIQLEATFIKD